MNRQDGLILALRKIRVVHLGTLFTLAACGSDGPGGPRLGSPDVTIDSEAIAKLPSDSLLHNVRDMAVDKGGRLWILSGFPPHVRVIDQTAELVTAFGPNGPGPGELRNPWYLVAPLPGDSADMLLWDVGSRRLEGYRADGEHVRGVSVQADLGFVLAGFRAEYFGEPLAIARFGDGFVLHTAVRQLVRPRDFWESKLVEFGPDGSQVAILLEFDELMEGPAEDLPSLFTPIPLWASCGPDSVLIWNPNGQVHLLSSDGIDPVGEIVIEEVAVSRRDIDRWVDHSVRLEVREGGGDPSDPGLLSFVQRAARELVSSTPELAPPVRARCDTQGSLWMQGFSTAFDPRGYGPRWQRFGADPLTVLFPRGFQPLLFSGDRVYGVLTDELGVQAPAWVPLAGRIANEAGGEAF